MNKYTYETAREALSAFPPNGTFGLLTALLRRESTHEETLAGLCIEAYKNADRAPFLLHTLEDLATRNERRCGEFRAILDELHALCRTDAPAGSRQYAIPLAPPDDSIDIGYDCETNTLQVLLPTLLPLKTTKAEFLPWQVQRAMRRFDADHKAAGGEPIRIFPAFVLLIHHYEAKRLRRNSLRDFDNLEWSATLNSLQSSHYFSDNAAEMVLMQMAVPDSSSFTEIVITPVARMPELFSTLDFSLYERPALPDHADSA